ncbi:MAG: hypothetical protein RLZZ594_208, partial [Actinomycetota bacterium]
IELGCSRSRSSLAAKLALSRTEESAVLAVPMTAAPEFINFSLIALPNAPFAPTTKIVLPANWLMRAYLSIGLTLGV